MQTEIVTANTMMYWHGVIAEALRSGDAGRSAEECRHRVIREEAHAWQQRFHGCEQLTRGLLKAHRPGADQNRFKERKQSKNSQQCSKDTIHSKFRSAVELQTS